MLDAYSNQYLKVKSVPDFQMQNMWVLEFKDFPNNDYLIYETSLPLNAISLGKTSWDLVLPESKSELDDFTFTFYETINFEGFAFLASWLGDIYDFENRVWKKGFHSKKKSAKLKYIQIKSTDKGIFGSVGNIVNLIRGRKKYEIYETATFDVYGLMIKNLGNIEAGSDSGDPLTFTATMSVQAVRPIVKYSKLT